MPHDGECVIFDSAGEAPIIRDRGVRVQRQVVGFPGPTLRAGLFPRGARLRARHGRRCALRARGAADM